MGFSESMIFGLKKEFAMKVHYAALLRQMTHFKTMWVDTSCDTNLARRH
jgi:hypothetical protein